MASLKAPEIVAWTGHYANFAAALASGAAYVGWVGSALSGGSLGWEQGTGAPDESPPLPPVATPHGAGGVENLVLTTLVAPDPSNAPEPSTLVLAGLGAAGLCLFLRRK